MQIQFIVICIQFIVRYRLPQTFSKSRGTFHFYWNCLWSKHKGILRWKEINQSFWCCYKCYNESKIYNLPSISDNIGKCYYCLDSLDLQSKLIILENCSMSWTHVIYKATQHYWKEQEHLGFPWLTKLINILGKCPWFTKLINNFGKCPWFKKLINNLGNCKNILDSGVPVIYQPNHDFWNMPDYLGSV